MSILPNLNKSPEYPVGWHVKVNSFIIVRIRHVNVTRPEHSLINEGDDIAGPVLVGVIEVGRQEWAGEQDGPSHGSSIQLVAVGRLWRREEIVGKCCGKMQWWEKCGGKMRSVSSIMMSTLLQLPTLSALPPTSKTQHSMHTVN
jgi:hypothetical protein